MKEKTSFDWESIDVHPMALMPILIDLENTVNNILSKESEKEVVEFAKSQGYDYAGDIRMICQAINTDITGLRNAIKNKCVSKLN